MIDGRLNFKPGDKLGEQTKTVYCVFGVRVNGSTNSYSEALATFENDKKAEEYMYDCQHEDNELGNGDGWYEVWECVAQYGEIDKVDIKASVGKPSATNKAFSKHAEALASAFIKHKS